MLIVSSAMFCLIPFLLSFSGPKRYDVVDGRWIYTHDRVALHDLLTREMSEVLGETVDLTQLVYSRIPDDEGTWA